MSTPSPQDARLDAPSVPSFDVGNQASRANPARRPPPTARAFAAVLRRGIRGFEVEPGVALAAHGPRFRAETPARERGALLHRLHHRIQRLSADVGLLQGLVEEVRDAPPTMERVPRPGDVV